MTSTLLTDAELAKIVYNAETSKCLRANEVTLPLPVFDALVNEIRDGRKRETTWKLHLNDVGYFCSGCASFHCHHQRPCFD